MGDDSEDVEKGFMHNIMRQMDDLNEMVDSPLAAEEESSGLLHSASLGHAEALHRYYGNNMEETPRHDYVEKSNSMDDSQEVALNSSSSEASPSFVHRLLLTADKRSSLQVESSNGGRSGHYTIIDGTINSDRGVKNTSNDVNANYYNDDDDEDDDDDQEEEDYAENQEDEEKEGNMESDDNLSRDASDYDDDDSDEDEASDAGPGLERAIQCGLRVQRCVRETTVSLSLAEATAAEIAPASASSISITAGEVKTPANLPEVEGDTDKHQSTPVSSDDKRSDRSGSREMIAGTLVAIRNQSFGDSHDMEIYDKASKKEKSDSISLSSTTTSSSLSLSSSSASASAVAFASTSVKEYQIDYDDGVSQVYNLDELLELIVSCGLHGSSPCFPSLWQSARKRRKRLRQRRRRKQKRLRLLEEGGAGITPVVGRLIRRRGQRGFQGHGEELKLGMLLETSFPVKTVGVLISKPDELQKVSIFIVCPYLADTLLYEYS